MKHYIFFLFFVGISAIGDDTPIAVVKGTNVLYTTIADTYRFVPPTYRFVPPAGASNVVITAEEASIIGNGWRYVRGQFLQPDGSAIVNGTKAKVDRSILIRDTIADFQAALANWDTLTAAQQKAVLKRCVQVLTAMLKERPELISAKEEQ